VDKKHLLNLLFSLSISYAELSVFDLEIFFLVFKGLALLSTFPQFGAKLISLYLFSVKNCEKVSKNLLITLWISLFFGVRDGSGGYPQSY